MQTFKIELNNRYTAITETVTATTENIGLDNGYYVYNVSNGGGMVDFSNVRGYLNDQKNKQITNDFFAYLTGNTTTSQALNILGSDEKLSRVFNDYYQRIVLSGIQFASTVEIQKNLTGSTQIIGYTYNHLWNGYSSDQQLTGIPESIDESNMNSSQSFQFTQNFSQNIPLSNNSVQSFSVWQEFTREPSYYIPVYIERGTNQLSKYRYDFCDATINKMTRSLFPQFSAITDSYKFPLPVSSSTRLHTILDCFVDINLETNENIGL